MSQDPKSILVVTLSNIGDVIMTTPVMMALRNRYPSARITVVVGPKAKPLLEKSKDLHRVIVYDKKAGWLSKGRFLLELWKDRYDVAVDLRNTAIPFLVFASRKSPLLRTFKNINMRNRHLEVLEKTIGVTPPLKTGCDPDFQFFDIPDELAVLKKLKAAGVSSSSGWILIAPGAASERKRWPMTSFREVTRYMALKTGKDVFLVGSKEERLISDAVGKDLIPSVKNFCGETTLSETAFLISRASVVIANDSAIMHLGYELGVPTVGIFGPTDHEKYGHTGKKFKIAREEEILCGCGSGRLPSAERNCFHGLKPEKVIQLSEELLARHDI